MTGAGGADVQRGRHTCRSRWTRRSLNLAQPSTSTSEVRSASTRAHDAEPGPPHGHRGRAGPRPDHRSTGRAARSADQGHPLSTADRAARRRRTGGRGDRDCPAQARSGRWLLDLPRCRRTGRRRRGSGYAAISCWPSRGTRRPSPTRWRRWSAAATCGNSWCRTCPSARWVPLSVRRSRPLRVLRGMWRGVQLTGVLTQITERPELTPLMPGRLRGMWFLVLACLITSVVLGCAVLVAGLLYLLGA